MKKTFTAISGLIVDGGQITDERYYYVGRKISIERLVNKLRKERKNQMLTLTDIQLTAQQYVIADEDIIKYGTPIDKKGIKNG